MSSTYLDHCQWDPWACLLAKSTSYRGVTGDSETRRVFFTFSLLLNLVLVAVMAEKPALHRYEVGNGSSVFRASMPISLYSPDALIQKDDSDVESKSLFSPPSFLSSISWSSCFDGSRSRPSSFWNGSCIHPLPFLGSFLRWEKALKRSRQWRQVAVYQLTKSRRLFRKAGQVAEHVKNTPVDPPCPGCQFGFESRDFVCQSECVSHPPQHRQI